MSMQVNSNNNSTYSFLRSFELSRIPCPQNAQIQHDIANGVAKLNIDGKPIYGGFTFNGQCHFGYESRPEGGYFNPTGNNQEVFGGKTIFYSDNVRGQGPVTATTSNAIQLANQNWG
jgi:hypothetical protein